MPTPKISSGISSWEVNIFHLLYFVRATKLFHRCETLLISGFVMFSAPHMFRCVYLRYRHYHMKEKQSKFYNWASIWRQGPKKAHYRMRLQRRTKKGKLKQALRSNETRSLGIKIIIRNNNIIPNELMTVTFKLPYFRGKIFLCTKFLVCYKYLPLESRRRILANGNNDKC